MRYYGCAHLALDRYYFINTFICSVATFAYFAMLSGQGWTAIAGCRQFFYVRYLDWLITTPLLILDLGGSLHDMIHFDRARLCFEYNSF